MIVDLSDRNRDYSVPLWVVLECLARPIKRDPSFVVTTYRVERAYVTPPSGMYDVWPVVDLCSNKNIDFIGAVFAYTTRDEARDKARRMRYSALESKKKQVKDEQKRLNAQMCWLCGSLDKYWFYKEAWNAR